MCPIGSAWCATSSRATLLRRARSADAEQMSAANAARLLLDAIDDRLHRRRDAFACREVPIEAQDEPAIQRLHADAEHSLDLPATRHDL